MSDDALRQLMAQGLSAMKAGGEVAARATAEISQDASDPRLKAGLEEGNRKSEEWTRRLDRAVQQVGGDSGGTQDNPILEAHYEVSRRIRAQAPDAQSRDLGIIADGQLATHYWIAAYGTMRAYAQQLGLSEVADDMQASLDDAKQADQAMNDIAAGVLRQAA